MPIRPHMDFGPTKTSENIDRPTATGLPPMPRLSGNDRFVQYSGGLLHFWQAIAGKASDGSGAIGGNPELYWVTRAISGRHNVCNWPLPEIAPFNHQSPPIQHRACSASKDEP